MSRDRDPVHSLEELRERTRTVLETIRQILLENAVLNRTRTEELRIRMEEALAELERYATRVGEVSQRDARALFEIRARVLDMERELNALTAPPQGIATIMQYGGKQIFTVHREDGTEGQETIETYWVYAGTRLLRVHIPDQLYNTEKERLLRGRFVMVNEASNIVAVVSDELQEILSLAGEEVTVDEVLDGERIRIVTRLDEKHTVLIPKTWPKEVVQKIRVGDKWLLPQAGSGMFLGGNEPLPKSEISELLLEKVPDLTYEQIGGLKSQIQQIRDVIELPYLYPQLFRDFRRELSKGILLYGPPGCGKTLIAKAVAKSLADQLSQRLQRTIQGYFLNVKGPEILNKYVGESERKIREMFQKAREKASEDCPVIIFVDEADSVLRTRGSGISSDMESTMVPQFLVMLDGLESLSNVLVILASNRQDLIDPAVLRPGRIDVKIRVGRPDKSGAEEVFHIYVKPDLPLHPKYVDPQHAKFLPKYAEFAGKPELVIKHIVTEAVKRLWASKEEPYSYRNSQGETVVADNKFMDVVIQGGTEFPLYLKDLASGAMIKSIVDRAKLYAIKRAIAGGERGLMTLDFCTAVSDEMDENEELPNTQDDAQRWLEVQGRRERIAGVRLNLNRKKKKEERRTENISGGVYL